MTADTRLKSQIRDWWAGAPMTYGEKHGSTDYVRADGSVERVVLGSKRFFDLADERFYAWNTSLHTGRGHFATIFPYDHYRGRDVLEVGCGMGCMAMNWALNGARITAVDLNPVAIAQTRQRFAVHQLAGTIHEADAEALPFADASFDFVYSWGVLHHTPHAADALGEIRRVLKPGGELGVMLYHRNSLLYRYTVAFIEGWLNMERDFLDELGLASRYGDGGREEGNPHTWPVTRKEVREDLFASLENVSIKTLGTDIPDLLNALLPSLADHFTPEMKSALARRFGWSLWITGRKGRT